MYEFYCDPKFQAVVAEARAARRAYISAVWTRVTRRSADTSSRVALG